MAPRFLKNKVLRRIVSITFCSLLIFVAKIDVIWFFNGMVVLVGGILVFVASFDMGYLINKGLFRNILVYIGERSYSMYLTHLICISLTRDVYILLYGGLPIDIEESVVLILISFVLIFILSEFSYRFVESSLREKGRRISVDWIDKHVNQRSR